MNANRRRVIRETLNSEGLPIQTVSLRESSKPVRIILKDCVSSITREKVVASFEEIRFTGIKYDLINELGNGVQPTGEYGSNEEIYFTL